LACWTDAGGFPLMAGAFDGNKAETKTMLPVIGAFMRTHQLSDVTVVADAGMISEANKKAIEAAGLSFILGMKIPDVPYVARQWGRDHPGPAVRVQAQILYLLPSGVRAPLWVRRGQVRREPRRKDLLPMPGGNLTRYPMATRFLAR
jgi:Transposase DDE domain